MSDAHTHIPHLDSQPAQSNSASVTAGSFPFPFPGTGLPPPPALHSHHPSAPFPSVFVARYTPAPVHSPDPTDDRAARDFADRVGPDVFVARSSASASAPPAEVEAEEREAENAESASASDSDSDLVEQEERKTGRMRSAAASALAAVSSVKQSLFKPRVCLSDDAGTPDCDGDGLVDGLVSTPCGVRGHTAVSSSATGTVGYSHDHAPCARAPTSAPSSSAVPEVLPMPSPLPSEPGPGWEYVCDVHTVKSVRSHRLCVPKDNRTLFVCFIPKTG